jgi:hypothetical protein
MGEGEGSYVWSFSDQDLGAPKKSLKREEQNDRKGSHEKTFHALGV